MKNIMITIIVMMGIVFFNNPPKAFAECTTTAPQWWCNPVPSDSCVTIGGGSVGVAYYNCGYNPDTGCSGCAFHTYTCDSACGSPGVPGGGGGGSCAYDIVNCPAGTVADYGTPLSSVCTSDTYCPGPGTAQQNTGCCAWDGGDTVCGDWYWCRWDQYGNPITPMCRDCETTDPFCIRTTKVTYACVAACGSTAPTNLQVVDGPVIGTSATISWTPGTPGTVQKIRVDEAGADESGLYEVNNGCPTAGDCELVMDLANGVSEYTLTNLLPLTKYYFRIVTFTDASCYQSAVTSYTTPDSIETISGQVFIDNNNECSMATPWTTGGVSVVLDANPAIGISSIDGSFSFDTNGSESHNLAASIPAGYSCSTGVGCSTCTRSGVVAPSTQNFFLSQNRAAWWQVMGGPVYAGSSAGLSTIGSSIPSSTYLILPGVGGTAAAALRASGDTPSLGSGSVNEDGWNAKTTYKGKRTDYAFFAKEMGLTSATTSLFNLDTKPSTTADFHYLNGTGTIPSASDWTIAANEKFVIFVNGDLNINANITIEDGGFLAFIVKDNINVDAAVTNISGLFVADDNFNTYGNGTLDTQLTIEGSVATWGSVSLARDMVGNNSANPAELFVYRPNLLTAMPSAMKSFVMQWSEVVPGTYDE